MQIWKDVDLWIQCVRKEINGLLCMIKWNMPKLKNYICIKEMMMEQVIETVHGEVWNKPCWETLKL